MLQSLCIFPNLSSDTIKDHIGQLYRWRMDYTQIYGRNYLLGDIAHSGRNGKTTLDRPNVAYCFSSVHWFLFFFFFFLFYLLKILDVNFKNSIINFARKWLFKPSFSIKQIIALSCKVIPTVKAEIKTLSLTRQTVPEAGSGWRSSALNFISDMKAYCFGREYMDSRKIIIPIVH